MPDGSIKKTWDGRYALYLDYYYQGSRIKEYLQLHLLPGQVSSNKATLELAENMRAKRDHEIKSGQFGFIAAHKKKANFIAYLQQFVDSYEKANKRMYRAAANAFGKFIGTEHIPCSAVSERLLIEFKAHLVKKHTGSTAYDYFKVFKKMVRQAARDGLFQRDPSADIVNKNTGANEFTKDVLFDNEIRKLSATDCGNAEVKRAFLFSTQTAMRKCDVLRLKWKHVFIGMKYIDWGQKKTQVRNFLPLNSGAIKLLGAAGDAEEFVFNLGVSDNAVNDDIAIWVKRAGITKHITYHCARHSFAINMLMAGVDLKTVSKCMGHTSTKHTEKYLAITDAMKIKAVNKLPKIRF